MKSVSYKLFVLTALFSLGGAVVAQADPAPDGKVLFGRKCAACHQATGRGIPGAFPALAGDKFVLTKNDEPIITTVLKGRGGMPSFVNNTDDAGVAAILTYVRSSWGNTAAPVKPESVAKVRKSLGNAAVHKLNN